MRVSTGVVGATTRTAHGVVLAFPIALFAAAVVTDVAYLRTAELQWSHFSAWLIAGGVASGAAALACGLMGGLLSLRSPRRGAWLLHVLLLAAMCVVGLVNAFKHSQDGWSSVGLFGATLTFLCALLALGAGALVYSGATDEERV